MSALILLLPSLVQGIGKMIETINAIRAAARRTGELTPEQDADYQQQLDKMFNSDAWKI